MTTSDESVYLLVRSPQPDVPVGALSFLSQVPSRLLPQPSDAPHCRPACLCSLAVSSGMGNKFFCTWAHTQNDVNTSGNPPHEHHNNSWGFKSICWCGCRTFQPCDHALQTHCTLAFLSPNNDDEDEHQNLCSSDHFNCGQCPISEFANLGAWHSILSWSRIFPSLSHFHP